jgi:hypothetical protein
MATERYKSPYTLRQIVNTSPDQAATTGGRVETALSALAADQAQRETASQRWSSGMDLKEKELALRNLSTQNKQAVAESTLDLEQQAHQDQMNQAKKSTIYAGVKAGLDIGGGYLAGRQADKIAAKYGEMFKKVEDQIAFNDKYLAAMKWVYNKQLEGMGGKGQNDLYQ